jgi:hypothetical protein
MIGLRDPSDPAGLSRLINRQIDAALGPSAPEGSCATISAPRSSAIPATRLAYQYAGIAARIRRPAASRFLDFMPALGGGLQG